MAPRNLYRWLKWRFFQWDIGNEPVHMIRPNLANIPQCALPDGYQLRPYQAGDEHHWREIHLKADTLNLFPPEMFAQQFGNDTAVLQARQFYLINPQDEVVGTASAWWDDEVWGKVHWVAIVPEEQGRGLAKPLLTAVLNTLQNLGHKKAKLETGSGRLPAVNLYLSYGFEPDVKSDYDAFVWRVVKFQLRNGR
ncbi:MAG: GNAT family N-acetyltransferase [Chloroflexota bacterium]